MKDIKNYKLNFERKYAKTKGSYWNLKPSKRLIKFEKLLKRNSKVLDLGCGTGRVALYLASKGHKVTAMDISKTGIDKLNEYSERSNLKIKTFVDDLEYYKISDNYDAIVSLYSIHFLPKKKVLSLVKNIQGKTRKNGLNWIGVFREGERNNNRYKFKNGELSSYYKYPKWEIESYEEYPKSEKHGDGPWHSHELSIIMSRKKS